MGKLSAFIPVAAETLGVPQTAIEAYVKPLRKAQKLTSGARGTAAPNITARDCATIVASVMIGSPTHAVERIEDYGEMLACLGEDHVIAREFGLSHRHTFIDMFTAVLEAIRDNTFTDKVTNIFISEGTIPDDRLNEDGTLIEFDHYASVTVNTSCAVAFINFRCICNSYNADDWSVRYLPAYVFDEEKRREHLENLSTSTPQTTSKGGLYYEANIGPGVLEDIGRFLRE